MDSKIENIVLLCFWCMVKLCYIIYRLFSFCVSLGFCFYGCFSWFWFCFL